MSTGSRIGNLRPAKGATRPSKRRGKGEEFTGAKEAEVETRTPVKAAELELPKPTDLEYHRKQITGWKEKVTTAQGHYRNAVKAAKKAGIDVDAMNDAEAIKRENDPAAAMRRLQQFNMNLEQIGSSLRVVVYDTLAGDVKKQAYQRGQDDAANGRTANNPYPEGSDLGEEYAVGYRNKMGAHLGLTEKETEDAVNGAGNDAPTRGSRSATSRAPELVQ